MEGSNGGTRPRRPLHPTFNRAHPRDGRCDLDRQGHRENPADEVTNGSDARWTAPRELDAAAASLETTAQFYTSPVAVLARAGIGTAERTIFLTQLSDAGPVKL